MSVPAHTYTLPENDNARLLASGKDGFTQLYTRYAPILLGHISKIIPEQEKAADVLQRSFAHIWQRRHEYDASARPLCTWMLCIARDISLTHANKNTLEKEIHNTFSFVDIDAVANSVGTHPDSCKLRKAVLQAVHEKGATISDIATIMKVDADKIMKMLYSAVNDLKSLPR